MNYLIIISFMFIFLSLIGGITGGIFELNYKTYAPWIMFFPFLIGITLLFGWILFLLV